MMMSKQRLLAVRAPTEIIQVISVVLLQLSTRILTKRLNYITSLRIISPGLPNGLLPQSGEHQTKLHRLTRALKQLSNFSFAYYFIIYLLQIIPRNLFHLTPSSRIQPARTCVARVLVPFSRFFCPAPIG